MPNKGTAKADNWLQITRLGQDHIEQIMELQSLVRNHLKNKELCVYVSRDEYREMLGNKGIVLGAMADKKLVGIFSALFPGRHHPENLGKVLDLSGDELERVGHLEIAFVHPDYRGQNLYYLLGERIIRTMKTGSPVRHLSATIDPRNTQPLNKALGLDLQIVQIKIMHGGLPRFILYRDLARSVTWDHNKSITVDRNDINHQQELLQSGWRGVRFIRESDTALIQYRKLSTNGG